MRPAAMRGGRVRRGVCLTARGPWAPQCGASEALIWRTLARVSWATRARAQAVESLGRLPLRAVCSVSSPEMATGGVARHVPHGV